MALFGRGRSGDDASDRDDGEPNWCGACQMHYSTWANHIILFRHNHIGDSKAEDIPDHPPDEKD